MTPLEVRIVPIAELTPAPYNPRRVLSPKSAAYRKLKASLVEFGLVEPLVWNELSGHVVGGHARLAILRELGAQEVPVSVVRLSPAREQALNIVLNNQEAQGRYDPARLADLLIELEGLPERELTGFDEAAVSVLRFESSELEELPRRTDRVEVTLVTDAATYARLEPKLDDLVQTFGLITHVRREEPARERG